MNNQNDGWRLPAEWEEQSGIQLTWPHSGTDWQPVLDKITATYVEMARAIAEREKLLVATPQRKDTEELLRSKLGDSLMSNVRVYECPTNDTWARDHGAITLVRGGKCRLLDFRFNGWGEKFEAGLDNRITSCLYGQGAFEATIERHDDFVLEGGSIESDGKGTVFTTVSCLMEPHRNPSLKKAGIEWELKRRLRAKNVVWIGYGQLKGDDTDGHIDTLVRTAPDDTLLYVMCSESDSHYKSLKDMEDQLRTLRTTEGKPYRLLRLPMAPAMKDGNERLPSTYANFVILNGAVIVPEYGDCKTDNEAKEVIAQAFPRREIIGIDSRTAVLQHGSLHCCTMQYPATAIK